MANTVKVYREDVTTDLLTYQSIKLYSDTTPDGAFSNLVTTITLVAAQEAYSYSDSAGTGETWYRYRLYHGTGPVQSSFSEAWQVEGISLSALRVEAAQEAGLGWASTCTALGTVQLLSDELLLDQGAAADFAEGAWIYRPAAADATDITRRVAESTGFNTSSGGLVPTRAWTNAPADDEAYHVFMLVPPVDQPGAAYSWDRAVRDGLRMVKVRDKLNLGEGTSTGQRRFSLGTHIGYVNDASVHKVWARTTDSNGIIDDVDYDTNLRFWGTVSDSPGELSVELYPPPSTDQTIWADVTRGYGQLYDDDDVTLCPRELAVAATAFSVWDHMNRVTNGRYADNRGLALEKYNRVHRDLLNTKHTLRRGA